MSHLENLEMRSSHVLRQVLAISGPQTSGHIQIRVPSMGAERLGHVGLHRAVQANRSETVVGFDSRVELLHLDGISEAKAVGWYGIAVADAVRAVEEKRSQHITGTFRCESWRLGVEDLWDVGGQGQLWRLGVTTDYRRVQLLNVLTSVARTRRWKFRLSEGLVFSYI